MNTLKKKIVGTRYKLPALALAVLLAAWVAPAYSQTTGATVDFTIKANTLTLTVQSPVPVSQFQVAVNTTTPYVLTPSSATLSGFMAGATSLGPLSNAGFNQYRWWNLNASSGQTGAVSIQITPPSSNMNIVLFRVSLLDKAGNTIPILGALPRDAVQIITQTTTSTATATTTTTATTTVTRTTELTSTQTRTATATVTTTAATPVTVTSTATTTVATPVTTTRTTTVTSPTTVTATPVEAFITTTQAALLAAPLVLIIAVLAVLVTRRKGQ